MMTVLPPVDEIRHLLGRLHANDITWFQHREAAGDLAWIHDRLPDSDRPDLHDHIEAGDLHWLRGRLGLVLRTESVDGLDATSLDLWTRPATVASSDDPADAGVAAVGTATVATAGVGTTAVATVATAAAGAALSRADVSRPPAANHDERRRMAALLLLPVGLLAAIGLGVGLNRWADNGKDASVGKVLSFETATPTDTAAASDTSIATEPTAAPDPVAATADIVDTLSGTGGFTKLAAALQAAGITETLKGAGPYTLFAPNDAAFDALSPGLLAALLRPENKATLVKVLSYHVIEGVLTTSDVKNGTVASGGVATLEGPEGSGLDLAPTADTFLVNDVKVLAADIKASNGIVHVIEKVLLPADVDLSALGEPATTVA